MKSMKVSDYFKIVRPKYIYLKVVPSTSIRNYKSDNIAKAVASMQRNFTQRIRKENKQLFFETPEKVSYFIYIEKGKVEFFFIIPENYFPLFREKISDTWHGITAIKVDSIPEFSNATQKYKVTYKKEDALSLATDKRTNTLLSSILSVINVIEDGDRIGLCYNFIPMSQYTWRATHSRTIKKIEDNYPVDREKMSAMYVFKMGIALMFEVVNIVMDTVNSLFGGKKEEQFNFSKIILSDDPIKSLQKATLDKKEATVIRTQIAIFSESESRIRAYNGARSVCEAFKSVTGDNELIYKRTSGKNALNKYNLAGTDAIITSPLEAQQFIALPAREILEEYKTIEHKDVIECPLPEELNHGYIPLGITEYHGKKQQAYLRDEYHLGNRPLVAMGAQGCGKTTYLSNYTISVNSRKEAVIALDFIKNCELSQAIEAVVPKKDLLILDLSDFDNLQGLGYNEIKFKPGMKDIELLEAANLQAEQTMALIDAINYKGLPLTGQMRRYLSSAANIVFLNQGANIRDVINCLQNHKKRAEFIEKIPESLKVQLEDEITTLKDLDEITITKDKETKETFQEVTGTRESKIDGIQDRVNLLKEDSKLKFMFNKPLDGNIDLVEEVEKGKIILVKMPESKFPLPYTKNVLVTYFVTKIWLMLQLRGAMYDQPKRCHIVIDEVSQAPTCECILESILPQARKFGGRFVFSCHYLNQIEKIKEPLKAAGASYMIMQGTDKQNYESLKDELKPFELEDLLNMKEHQSMNLIAYEKGYARFITTLPKPIK